MSMLYGYLHINDKVCYTYILLLVRNYLLVLKSTYNLKCVIMDYWLPCKLYKKLSTHMFV